MMNAERSTIMPCFKQKQNAQAELMPHIQKVINIANCQGQRVWHQPFKGRGLGSMALAFPGNVRQADDVGGK